MPIREEFLSLAEVDDRIKAFETQYGITSADFLRESELRGRVSEDDIFQWEAFIAHRVELRRVDEETRSSYLETVNHTSGEAPANTELALAA